MAKGVVYQLSRSSKDPDPIPPPVPPKTPSCRRSLSNSARKSLEKISSGGGADGQQRSVDGIDGIGNSMRRIWIRRGSASPDRARNRDHRTQDRGTILSPVSATASRAYGEERVNTFWGFGRDEVQIQTNSQASSEVDLDDGPLRLDDTRGRSRHRDATHPTPAPPAPPPRPRFALSSPTKSPVIPTRPTGKPMESAAKNALRKPVLQERRRPILFYHKDEPHYGFTNFSAHPVDYCGKRYPTSEHLFQSFKVGSTAGTKHYLSSLKLSALTVLT